MRTLITTLLALAVTGVPLRAQSLTPPERSITAAGGVGLMATASNETDLAGSVDARLDQWLRPRLGLAAEASFASTFAGNCDAACFGPTRVLGLAGHGVVGLGPRSRPDMVSVSLGAGLYGTRYTLRGQQPPSESRLSVGASGVLQVEVGPSRSVTPVVTLRGLLLPDHDGAQARLISLGVGARW